MNARARSPYWRLLIVAADASWIFIGLYALGVWKKDLIAWIGAVALLQSLNWPSLTSTAQAAEGFTPVEFRQPALSEQLQRLFFYALLPMVWLVMAAIINGYELSAASPPRARRYIGLWATWRKWMRDFVKHFVGGYRSRYQPVWTCLKLTLSAGSRPCLPSSSPIARSTGWAPGFGSEQHDGSACTISYVAAHRGCHRCVHRQPERSRWRHLARRGAHRPACGGIGIRGRDPADGDAETAST